MKSYIAAAIVGLIAAVIIAGIVVFNILPRNYKGDRIKGSVCIYVDGTSADLSSYSFNCGENSVLKEITGEKAFISLRGGKYGMTSIVIDNGKEIPARINIMSWNWHQLTDFDIILYYSEKGCDFSIYKSYTTGELWTREKSTDSGSAKPESGYYVIRL